MTWTGCWATGLALFFASTTWNMVELENWKQIWVKEFFPFTFHLNLLISTTKRPSRLAAFHNIIWRCAGCMWGRRFASVGSNAMICNGFLYILKWVAFIEEHGGWPSRDTNNWRPISIRAFSVAPSSPSISWNKESFPACQNFHSQLEHAFPTNWNTEPSFLQVALIRDLILLHKLGV